MCVCVCVCVCLAFYVLKFDLSSRMMAGRHSTNRSADISVFRFGRSVSHGHDTGTSTPEKPFFCIHIDTDRCSTLPAATSGRCPLLPVCDVKACLFAARVTLPMICASDNSIR